MNEAELLQWAREVGALQAAFQSPMIQTGPTTYTGRCPFGGCDHMGFEVGAEAGKFSCPGCGRQGDALDYLVGIDRAGSRASAASLLDERRASLVSAGLSTVVDPAGWVAGAARAADFAAKIRGAQPLADPVDLAAAVSHERAPLVPGIAHRQDLIMVVGPSGAGKTSWAADLSGRVIDGLPFLGVAAHTPLGRGRVMWLNFDRPTPSVRGTLVRFGLHKQPADSFLLHTRLESNMKMDRPESVDALTDEIQRRAVSMVVIDSARGCRSTDSTSEQSADDIGYLLQGLQLVIERTGVTICILVHTGHDPTRERGSSAWRDAADRSYLIQARAGGGSKMKDLKQTDAAKNEDWRMLEWVGPDDDVRHRLLHEHHAPPPKTQKAPDHEAMVRAHLEAHGPTSPNALEKELGGRKGSDGPVRRAIARMLADGELLEVDGGKKVELAGAG